MIEKARRTIFYDSFIRIYLKRGEGEQHQQKETLFFYEGGNAVYLNFKRKFLLSLDIQLSSCLEHRENKTLEVVFNSQIR